MSARTPAVIADLFDRPAAHAHRRPLRRRVARALPDSRRAPHGRAASASVSLRLQGLLRQGQPHLVASYRGPGLDAGLRILSASRREVGVPVLTDVHDRRAGRAARPRSSTPADARLPLPPDRPLVAAAQHRLPTNIKKGQFLAPEDMRHVVGKHREAGGGPVVGHRARRELRLPQPRRRHARPGASCARPRAPPWSSTPRTRCSGRAAATASRRRPRLRPARARRRGVGIDGLFIEVHPGPRPRPLRRSRTRSPCRCLSACCTKSGARRRIPTRCGARSITDCVHASPGARMRPHSRHLVRPACGRRVARASIGRSSPSSCVAPGSGARLRRRPHPRRALYDEAGRRLLAFDVGRRRHRHAREGRLDLAVLSGRPADVAEHRHGARRHPLRQRLSRQGRGAREVCAKLGIEAARCAFVGDDLPDLAAFRVAGLRVAVADAVLEVIEHADWVTEKPGGTGAVREVCEAILKARGAWRTPSSSLCKGTTGEPESH